MSNDDQHLPQDDGALPDGVAGEPPSDAADDKESKPGLLHESLRRVLLGGASALLTTEEGIRNLIAERRLPKEALAALLAQTDKTRREVSKVIGRELGQVVANMDVAREVRRAVAGLRFDVQASIRVFEEPRAPAATPEPDGLPTCAAAKPASEAPPAGAQPADKNLAEPPAAPPADDTKASV